VQARQRENRPTWTAKRMKNTAPVPANRQPGPEHPAAALKIAMIPTMVPAATALQSACCWASETPG